MALVEIDTSLNIDDLDADLKDVEKRIKSLRKELTDKSFKLELDANEFEKTKEELEDTLVAIKNLREEINSTVNPSQAKVDALASLEQDADVLRAKLAEQEATLTRETEEVQNQNAEYDRLIIKSEAMSKELAKQEKIQKRNKKISGAVGGVFKDLGRQLKNLVRSALLIGTIVAGFRMLKDNIGSLIMKSNEVRTAVGEIKGSLQQMAVPIANALIPVVVTLANWFNQILVLINMIISKLAGLGFAKMKKDAQKAFGKSGTGGGKAGNGLSTASFDTLNQLQGSGSGGAGGGADQIDAIYDASELAENELNRLLTVIGLVGAALAAWKFPVAGLSFFENFIGYATLILGLIMSIKNLWDMWENGVTAGNLMGYLLGIVAVVTSLYFLFGSLAAGLGLVVGGLALLAVAFNDVAENGANLYNILAIIIGAFMIGMGIAVLTGSWIPLLIGAIAGIVLAFIALGGGAEDVIADIKQIFNGLITFLTGVFTGDWKKAWTGIKDIFTGLFKLMFDSVKSLVNGVIKGVNWLQDKLESVGGFLSAGGGSGEARHMAQWTQAWPLANGAVIPPNREFLAVLGDQKSGTNIEAPLDTIVEAVRQAGVGSGQNINIQFTGDLAQLARVLKPVIQTEAVRTGNKLIGGI